MKQYFIFLRQKKEHVGMMVTASHNPWIDNGVKIADANGGMLDPSWEGFASDLCNASRSDDVRRCVESWWGDGALRRGGKKSKFVPFFQIISGTFPGMMIGNSGGGGDNDDNYEKNSNNNDSNDDVDDMVAVTATVHVGRDMRSHSKHLANLAIKAMIHLGNVTIIDHGEVTTPELHRAVMLGNPHRLPGMLINPASSAMYSQENIGGGSYGYLEELAGSYVALLDTAPSPKLNELGILLSDDEILVDCACGVGGPKIVALDAILQRCWRWKRQGSGGVSHRQPPSPTRLVAYNLPLDGPPNDGCGAEHVQKSRTRPVAHISKGGSRDDLLSPRYAASLDGDADRIIFHYHRQPLLSSSSSRLFPRTGPTFPPQQPNAADFRLLDGDKIAALVAEFVIEELRYLDYGLPPSPTLLSCGIVQTAYANGASTRYLKVSNNRMRIKRPKRIDQHTRYLSNGLC